MLCEDMKKNADIKEDTNSRNLLKNAITTTCKNANKNVGTKVNKEICLPHKQIKKLL